MADEQRMSGEHPDRESPATGGSEREDVELRIASLLTDESAIIRENGIAIVEEYGIQAADDAQLRELIRSPRPEVRMAALQCYRAVSPTNPFALAAIPLLAGCLFDDDPPVAAYATRLLLRAPLDATLNCLEREGFTESQLATDWRPGNITVLLNIARGNIRPGIVPAEESVRRGNAFAEMVVFGREAIGVGNPRHYLEDADAAVREIGLLVLGNRPDLDMVSHLIRATTDLSAPVRFQALVSLGRIYEDSQRPPGPWVRILASEVFAIRPDECGVSPRSVVINGDVLGAIEKGLSDSSPLVRRGAAVALRMIGEPASLTVDGLLNCLADGDPAVRRAAVAALESIRPRSHAVIRALFKCLDSECEFDRWNARNAIIAVLRQLVPRGIQEQIDRLTLIPANSLSIREGIAAMLGSRPSWFEES